MKRSAIAIAICTLLGVLVMTASCSSAEDDAADECCPISEEPTCNFLAGGAKSLHGGQCIGVVYDAAPSTKSIDAKGCPVWSLGPACGAVSHYMQAATAARTQRTRPMRTAMFRRPSRTRRVRSR